MKIISITLAGLLSLVIIVVSHVTWVERTSVNGNTNVSMGEKERQNEDKANQSHYLGMAANWPEGAIQSYANTLENNVPYNVVLVGSTSTTGEEDSWAAQLSAKLHEHYQETMKVETVHFDRFSGDFNIDEVVRLSPDLVLIEPFLMKDNDWYEDVTAPLENIDNWRETLSEMNPEVTVMLQPANPFYLPQKYMQQVDALETYASVQGLTYINHWEAWPDTNDPFIREYLEEDYYPNEQGHHLWVEYLREYFIAEE
ncbi:SGNH/GDSL hydrolase family protein [Cytobacillus sp. FSL R7-0680]|uniref:SGNH/GDSL hydrolase family protein n=1 Tax=Cytobacillus sp. FSL R7-0680 TaxID=2921689 RepID=UPI0030F50719